MLNPGETSPGKGKPWWGGVEHLLRSKGEKECDEELFEGDNIEGRLETEKGVRSGIDGLKIKIIL